MEKIKAFLKRKNIIVSAKRYGIDALGAMAQGLFASLLIGTIISTIGEQAGIQLLVDIGGYAKAATGPAMAISIGFALQCPPLVLFFTGSRRCGRKYPGWSRRTAGSIDCHHLCSRIR